MMKSKIQTTLMNIYYFSRTDEIDFPTVITSSHEQETKEKQGLNTNILVAKATIQLLMSVS